MDKDEKTKNGIKDFKWRYQTSVNSDMGKMLAYLQNQTLHPSQSKTAMIMAALTTFYMPLALYNEGDRNRESLELVLLNSVKAIANHLKFTCVVLNIDTARIANIFYHEIGELESQSFSYQLDSNQLKSPINGTSPELEEFDPQMWNLAGITTDSTSFE